jgi:cytoskeletal protein CcmA (bactofilin family)
MTMFTGASAGPSGTSRLQSFIDRDSHFNGTHRTPHDLYIEGRFEGTIECAGALIVAETADVNARVSAESVSVAGHLQGEIGCRGRFEMLPTGRVEARVQAGTIVVHEGARYEGELRMGDGGNASGAPGASPIRRTEPRSARRTVSGDTAQLPSFGSADMRANGRAAGDGEAGRTTLPDQTLPSDTV